jgi:eukaryotic-like serine/threonine-protein kinase
MIPLGAFELQTRLGQGGMGEVWRGVHRGQHVPVAVKLLTNALARKEAFRVAFRNEVRAVAGLDHPHIVLVFDYGTVDEATQAASDGALRSGTPWLAMELAEDGSLDDPRHVRTWSELRSLLLSLLDALAHAHARGVVHRDIKPGNVLVAAHRVLKLTDFGLAHAMDRADGDFTAGTPSYMAPEQFEGRWRDYGPWTDLYAVGCLVHALCAGQPPYGVLQDWALGLDTHRYAPIPALVSRFPVPRGLSSWTRRLLAKDPRDRWRRAADAAAALLDLGEAHGRGAPDRKSVV